jgi:hypothetical protein
MDIALHGVAFGCLAMPVADMSCLFFHSKPRQVKSLQYLPTCSLGLVFGMIGTGGLLCHGQKLVL